MYEFVDVEETTTDRLLVDLPLQEFPHSTMICLLVVEQPMIKIKDKTEAKSVTCFIYFGFLLFYKFDLLLDSIVCTC